MSDEESSLHAGKQTSDMQVVTAVGNSWIICKSKSHAGRPYYFNTLTGQAVWNLAEAEIQKSEQATRLYEEQYGKCVFDACAEPQEILSNIPITCTNCHTNVTSTRTSTDTARMLNRQLTDNRPFNFARSQCSNYAAPKFDMPQPSHSNGAIQSNSQCTIQPHHNYFIAPTLQPVSYVCKVNKDYANIDFQQLTNMPPVQHNTITVSNQYAISNESAGNIPDPNSRVFKNMTPEKLNIMFKKDTSQCGPVIQDLRQLLSAKEKFMNRLGNGPGRYKLKSPRRRNLEVRGAKYSTTPLHLSSGRVIEESTSDLRKPTKNSLREFVKSTHVHRYWYIVADTEVLLYDFEFVENLIKSDGDSKLLVPLMILLELRRNTGAAISDTMTRARNVLRYIYLQEKVDRAIVDYKTDRLVIGGSSTLIEFCSKWKQMNFDVVLLTNSKEMLHFNNLDVTVLNIEQAKSLSFDCTKETREISNFLNKIQTDKNIPERNEISSVESTKQVMKISNYIQENSEMVTSVQTENVDAVLTKNDLNNLDEPLHSLHENVSTITSSDDNSKKNPLVLDVEKSNIKTVNILKIKTNKASKVEASVQTEDIDFINDLGYIRDEKLQTTGQTDEAEPHGTKAETVRSHVKRRNIRLNRNSYQTQGKVVDDNFQQSTTTWAPVKTKDIDFANDPRYTGDEIVQTDKAEPHGIKAETVPSHTKGRKIRLNRNSYQAQGHIVDGNFQQSTTVSAPVQTKDINFTNNPRYTRDEIVQKDEAEPHGIKAETVPSHVKRRKIRLNRNSYQAQGQVVDGNGKIQQSTTISAPVQTKDINFENDTTYTRDEIIQTTVHTDETESYYIKTGTVSSNVKRPNIRLNRNSYQAQEQIVDGNFQQFTTTSAPVQTKDIDFVTDPSYTRDEVVLTTVQTDKAEAHDIIVDRINDTCKNNIYKESPNSNEEITNKRIINNNSRSCRNLRSKRKYPSFQDNQNTSEAHKTGDKNCDTNDNNNNLIQSSKINFTLQKEYLPANQNDTGLLKQKTVTPHGQDSEIYIIIGFSRSDEINEIPFDNRINSLQNKNFESILSSSELSPQKRSDKVLYQRSEENQSTERIFCNTTSSPLTQTNASISNNKDPSEQQINITILHGEMPPPHIHDDATRILRKNEIFCNTSSPLAQTSTSISNNKDPSEQQFNETILHSEMLPPHIYDDATRILRKNEIFCNTTSSSLTQTNASISNNKDPSEQQINITILHSEMPPPHIHDDATRILRKNEIFCNTSSPLTQTSTSISNNKDPSEQQFNETILHSEMLPPHIYDDATRILRKNEIFFNTTSSPLTQTSTSISNNKDPPEQQFNETILHSEMLPPHIYDDATRILRKNEIFCNTTSSPLTQTSTSVSNNNPSEQQFNETIVHSEIPPPHIHDDATRILRKNEFHQTQKSFCDRVFSSQQENKISNKTISPQQQISDSSLWNPVVSSHCDSAVISKNASLQHQESDIMSTKSFDSLNVNIYETFSSNHTTSENQCIDSQDSVRPMNTEREQNNALLGVSAHPTNETISPKIMRRFIICPEFEERLKSQTNNPINSSSNNDPHLKESNNDDCFEQNQEEILNPESPYEQFNKSYACMNNVDISNSIMSFINMLIKNLQKRLSEIYSFCCDFATIYVNGTLMDDFIKHKTRRNSQKIKLFLTKLCEYLTSIQERETISHLHIESVLRKNGITAPRQIDFDEYRKKIGIFKKNATHLLDANNIVLNIIKDS